MSEPLDIGVVIEMSQYKVARAYLKPQKKLLDAAKETGMNGEYFPIIFTKEKFGEFDLCTKCFTDFMNLTNTPLT